MGIKDLWTILTPFCDRKPLFELQGKTVAVDLSGWVCQAQCIADYQVQPKMYLRNLYFRTCCLLLLDVDLVFVLEGDAPTLKHKTIQARNQVQFKGAKPRAKREGPLPAAKGRSRFHHVLKSCEEMLRLMGLSCLTAAGEAEAMCAYLNEKGMVDGCISQDSDCFAYGAKVVYRNFSISQQGAHAGAGGSVDVYDIQKAFQAIDFGRNKVVALALLCGSDYNEGVFGVGKDSAMKLFSTVPDRDILEHLRSWRSKASFYEELEKECFVKKSCSQCGHLGMKAAHTRSGCAQCGTHKGCNVVADTRRADIKNEIGIRNKALEDSGFPDEVLVEEFLTGKDSVGRLNLSWKKPDLHKYIAFTEKHLQWECVYGFEKIFPILTRWIVTHPKSYDPKLDPVPKFIKKIRNPKGVPSYEIIWEYEIQLQEAQSDDLDIEKLCTTIEPQHLVQTSFPDLVDAYNQSKIKPKKKREPKKPREAKKSEEPRKKREPKARVLMKQNSIENYIVKEIPACESDTSFFGDEDAECDLSMIIENIVGQGIPDIVRAKLNAIRALKGVNDDVPVCKRSKVGRNKSDLQQETEHSKNGGINYIAHETQKDDRVAHSSSTLKQPLTSSEISNDSLKACLPASHDNEEQVLNDSLQSDSSGDEINTENSLNKSHFFGDIVQDDVDEFERTFNELCGACDSDNEDAKASDDSFEEVYIPLIERLKRKQIH